MLIKPFGPEIYKTKLSEETRYKLEQLVLDNKDKKEKLKAPRLVGFIQKEINLYQELKDEVLIELQNVVLEYMNSTNTFLSGIKPFQRRDIQCLDGWANIQQPNEFAPIHSHNCDIVCVTFPKVELHSTSNKKIKPGSLFFSYGDGSGFFENTIHTVEPETGDVYVFPGTLKHGTYPIYENDLRISVNTNFCFTDYFRTKVNLTK